MKPSGSERFGKIEDGCGAYQVGYSGGGGDGTGTGNDGSRVVVNGGDSTGPTYEITMSRV